MADGVFNIAKGRVGHYSTLPEASDALIVVLLQTTGLETDDALNNHDNLASILTASNDEATFTNYTRVTLSGVTQTVDDTANRLDVNANDFTYTAAGGALNNSISKLLVCYDSDTTGGTDSNIVPLTYHDMVFTTDGTDLMISFAATGFYRAA